MNENIDNEWSQEFFDSNLSTMKSEEILGWVDVRDEWGKDKNPKDVFIHTRSYQSFTEKSTLFLYGRRGTGKTALIRMLCSEIEGGKLEDYQYCALLDSETSYSNLSIQIKHSPFINFEHKDLTITLKDKWKWIIEVTAMQKILEKNKNEIEGSLELKAIGSFLAAEGLSPIIPRKKSESINAMTRLSEMIAAEFGKMSDPVLQAGAATFRLSQKCFSSGYKTACESLYNFLNSTNSTCLVVLDSIEPYSAGSSIFKALTASIIEVALDFHVEHFANGILLKAAFPSEMEPHIKPLNISKADPKSIFIRWGYGALVSLLAKRYLKLQTGTHDPSKYKKMEDPYEARRYLYNFMPSTMKTKVVNEFDTIANIIRHTQKKPRQLIFLMNTILTLAKNNGIDSSELDEVTINNGIHARLDMPVNSTTDMYCNIYPDCLMIISAILVDKKNIMNMKELDSYLHSAANVVDGRLANFEIKRMLFEVGVIGTVRRKSNLQENKQIYETLFEYQVKGMLPYNEQSTIAVHPMFYTKLQTKVSLSELMYPVPGEDVEKEILKELKITLV